VDFSRHADPLRQIALRLEQGDLRQENAKPGVNESLRVSIHYHDGRSPASVATLHRGHGEVCRLSVAYDRYDRLGKPFIYSFNIPLERYQKLLAALRLNKFDQMDDEADVPFLGADLWFIERASGHFYHNVVIEPSSARGHHRETLIAIRTHLPEAVRELAG
jgi:hypothetical protein